MRQYTNEHQKEEHEGYKLRSWLLIESKHLLEEWFQSNFSVSHDVAENYLYQLDLETHHLFELFRRYSGDVSGLFDAINASSLAFMTDEAKEFYIDKLSNL